MTQEVDPNRPGEPPGGGPASGDGEGPPRGEVISPSALALARLLRLRPMHGPRPTGRKVLDPLEIPKWAVTLGILLTFLLFLALLIVFFLPGSASGATEGGINFDRPTRDWYQGPVRYIITKQEVKAYKALETELDRINFIDWFWQRRDIEPATPGNEFRARYEQRVFEANRKFSDTAKPGWKTDMGKIYILVGPPDEINSDAMAKTHRGIVTWVYRRPPFPDLNPNTVVGFARGPDGEFRLSSSPTLDSDVARGLQFARTKITADSNFVREGLADPALLAAGAPVMQRDLQTDLIYGRLQQLPPAEEDLFRSLVMTREFYGTIPAESRVDFYRAGGGSTYTTITVGIRASAVQFRTIGDREAPDLSIFGKLINKEKPDDVYPLASDSSFVESAGNAAAGLDGLLIYQAAGVFKPGLYQLILGVQDRVSRKIASFRRDVTIPDLTGEGMRLSSITLAGDMEATDYTSATSKPFRLGKFTIVPRPDSVFRKTDELNIYFQIYGPATDPATGRPVLDVVYSFKRRADDGTWKDFGAYQVKASAAQVQGYAVPLEKWPAGAYQVAVGVRDGVSGATVSSEVEFLIRP